jgi:hypothetical protein
VIVALGNRESRKLSLAWTIEGWLIEGWLHVAAVIALRSAAAERTALRIVLTTQ